MFHLICFFAVCFCSVLHQSPNARPILKLLVEGGKQWGHRPWSAGGMSGGAEQTDILSVLSLVKERWKVVSDAVFDNNANSLSRHCLSLVPPPPPPPPLLASKLRLIVRETMLSPLLHNLTCGLNSLCLCPYCAAAGKTKNSPYSYLWWCSFFFALQSGYVTVLPPGANVSCCCARLDVCHVEVLLLTGDFLSPGEPSYVRTLQLIPRLYILRRTVKVA